MAIIPARGGSKEIPGKNLKRLLGRPLLAWSIQQALGSPRIDRVVVSTDDDRIARCAREHGAEVPFVRPAALATDEAATEPVMLHALSMLADESYRPDAVVLLQPTSPLRLPGTLERALARFEQAEADSLLGVSPVHHFFWKRGPSPIASYDYHNRPRRQDLDEAQRWFRENGSIYISEVQGLVRSRNRLHGRIDLFEMAECESHEIDSLEDFVVVEALMRLHRLA